MATHVRCGTLFSTTDARALTDHTVVVDERGAVSHVGPTAKAPKPGPRDSVVDYSAYFVMPGLIDVHVHLAYGNAKSEEDIDLYNPLEFRALRGLFFAQKVLAAGYTALCAPGDAGQISLSIRNAIRAGLFEGPRVTAAGQYISARQSLTDWYPSWIGAPETSIGRLVASRDEAIAEIRRQVKNGVDRRQDRHGRRAAPARRHLDRGVQPGRDDRDGHRDPASRPQGGRARGRPRGDPVFGARRRRPDLPRLRRRRRMHRGDAGEEGRGLPDP